MANRFDTIFNREEYVPVVQPLPYEMLYKMGDDMEKKAEDDLQSSLKLQELFKTVKADPADYKYKQELDAEYAPQFARVTDLVLRGDPQAKKEMYALSAKFQTDSRIPILQHNYELGKKAADNYMALSSQDKTSAFGWSNKWTQAANSRTGLAPIPFEGHDPWSDPYSDAAPIMAGISSDAIKIGREGFDMGPNGKLIIKGKIAGADGVTKAKVLDEATRTLDIFKRTPGGQSLEKDLYAQGLTKQEDRDLYMVNTLFNVAHKQIHSNTTDLETLENAGDKYDTPYGLSTTEESEPIDMEAAGIPEAWDLIPSSSSSESDIANALSVAGEGPLGIDVASGFTDAQKSRMSTNKTWRNAYEKIGGKKKETVNRIARVALPGVNERIQNGSASEADYAELNMLAYKVGKSMSGGKVFSYYEGYPTDKRDDVTNYIFGKKQPTIATVGAGQFTGRQFFNPRTGEVMSGKQFYDQEIQKNIKESPDMLIQVTGENSGTSPVSLVTGDNNFDLSRTINVGGRVYIMSAGATEIESTPYGKIDLKQEATRNNIYYNMQWGIPSVKEAAYKVNHYSGATTTNEYIDGNKVGETVYNPDTKTWDTSLIVDGAPFKYRTDSPESIKEAIGQFYSQLKSKK